MKTTICPTCGCSLLRLGISKDKAATYTHGDKEYWFCCVGCVTLFREDPEKLLAETGDLVVCPTCLAEKPVSSTVTIIHEEIDLHFCRCPHCLDKFYTNPDYYIKRLTGQIDYAHNILG